MKLLENKIALITGATRGIGKRTALLFAEHGATVIFTDLQENEASQQTLAELQALSPKSTFYASNAAVYEEAEQVAERVKNDFGRLDVLVNNAGITRDTLLLRMQPKDWDLVIEVNLRSVFNYCKAFAPMMIRQRSGSIVNTSSIVGVNGNAGQCNYSASKAGIIGFSKSLAKELGSRNIRCNAIAPGYIETAMTGQLSEEVRKQWTEVIPMKRGGSELDVAKTSLFLASDLSEYITGQVICIDGGLSL
ncbi:MAG: 3-oxoacyl-[acyl-carrier-protein] reductase [Bacteroidales bacterium]|nr:3-oxoacyl-[acyl-carrier-protein] reductase [Bacteroidales bacterium]